jgi:hypothetical protein
MIERRLVSRPVSTIGTLIAPRVTQEEGARIVTEGLRMRLDVSNPYSYIGTGTSLADLSGSANGATMFNSPSAVYARNLAISLDGTDDYIGCSDPLTSDAEREGSLTFEYWLEPTATITTGRAESSTGYGYYTGSAQGLLSEHLYKPLNSSFAAFMFQFGTNGFIAGCHNFDYAPSFLVDYKTYTGISHLVVTKSATGATYYINGVSIKSGSQSRTLGAVVTNVTSSTSANEFGRFFQGRIYAYALYTRALSNGEILQNFNALRGRFSL